MGTKILGRNIVADPAICHGEPTFRGTRILVAEVLGTGSQRHGLGGDYRRMAWSIDQRSNCRGYSLSS